MGAVQAAKSLLGSNGSLGADGCFLRVHNDNTMDKVKAFEARLYQSVAKTNNGLSVFATLHLLLKPHIKSLVLQHPSRPWAILQRTSTDFDADSMALLQTHAIQCKAAHACLHSGAIVRLAIHVAWTVFPNSMQQQGGGMSMQLHVTASIWSR